ncbi:MAG TPA: sigma-70 family RNA polymerase sigma factor [Puia sp.]|nr:sigma-70 family RNA polymerase sigma factor [Puia sp.]
MPAKSRLSSTEVSSLLRRTAQGDEHAFARLVDEYWNNIYTQSLVYTRSVQQAEEATQDIFMKIWNSRVSLPSLDNFENFLFIVARNVIISALRKKRGLYVVEPAKDIIEGAPSPDQQFAYKESYDIINRGIDLMPPQRKQVFRLSRLEGMSHEEISRQLGISRNTVKEHIVKGLHFLRGYLKSHGGNTFFLLLFFEKILL